MDFATAWIPSLKGKICAPCDSYESVKDDRPNSISHRPWAEKTLRAELNKTPDARKALWEGILALWQLKLVEGEGKEDVNWQNLVSAWLHRHRDICWHFHIAPYDVVSNLAARLGASGSYPIRLIPSWDQPTLVSDAESDKVPKDVPEIAPNPNRKQKSRKSTLMINSDNDVNMVDTNPPSITHSTQGSKKQAPPEGDVSAGMRGSQVEQSDTGVLKRRPEESPPQARGPYKRIRETVSPVQTEHEVDLSHLTVQENSEIDPSVLPAIKGKRCEGCPTAVTCAPIWHTSRGTFPVHCRWCVNFDYSCSFERMDWGVKGWPRINVTQPVNKANARRRPPSVDNKIRKTVSGAKIKGKETLLGGKQKRRVGTSAKNQEGNSFKPAEINLHDVIRSPPITPPIVERAPNPNPIDHGIIIPDIIPDDPFVTLSAITGRGHNVFLQSYRHFESMLSEPNRTPATIRMRATELACVSHQESGEAEAFAKLIEGRNAIAADLIEELLAEACRLERDAGLVGPGAAEDTENVRHRDDRDAAVGTRRETDDIENQLFCNSPEGSDQSSESESGTDSDLASNRDVQESS